MNTCNCRAATPRTPSWVRFSIEGAGWVFPSAMLALMPKCPACLVIYVAVWTGLGLSLTTAMYLRTSLLFLCVVSLLYLVITRFGRLVAARKLKKLLTN